MDGTNVQNRKNSTSQTIVVNVGSRNSQLALIQTERVTSKLQEFYTNNPDHLKQVYPEYFPIETSAARLKFNVISMTTIGDKVLDKPLPEIGAKSLFTKELEVELVNGRVDMIVHSLKDLPTTLPDGCIIGAVMKRDSPDDTIVLKKSLLNVIKPLDLLFGRSLNHGNLKIGTSSQRRIAMIHRCNSLIECTDIRGNLNTRLTKLDNEDSEYSAIILARAGLDRMGWAHRGSSLLTPSIHQGLSEWCYAVGQGAIAVECKSADVRLMKLISPIIDLETTFEVIAERSLMRKLEGGCSVPLGVRSNWIDDKKLSLEAVILSVDGKKCVKASEQYGLNQVPKVTQLQLSHEPTPAFSCIAVPFLDEEVQANSRKCFELGSIVANKMISLGCLDLIR